MAKKVLKDVTVAEAYFALLADRGVDYWFANAGTDFAPVVEALTKSQTTGLATPRPIICPHENTAIHMAIGAYLVKRMPQAVMVHVNVGTANGLNGLLNANRGNIPVLFTAGRSPTTEDTLHGHRNLDIHWTQEMFDQGGMVREAVKWDYELRWGAHLEAVVDRALSIARSDPQGPVYLTLPREPLAERMETFTYSSPGRQQPAAPAFPNEDAVDEVAALLAKAENPVLITNQAGRDPETFYALAEFAEAHAIPVVQYRNRYFSMANDHPMHLGFDPSKFLEVADVVLCLDIAVPWLPAEQKVPEDAKIVHIGPDPLHSYVPLRGHPADYALTCASWAGLRKLGEALAGHGAKAKPLMDKRRKALAERHAQLRENWRGTLEKVKNDAPMHPAWVTHCISEIKDDDSIVIAESPLRGPFINVTKPATVVNAGTASGLGWGLGAALGAKLADPDRLVIGTHGDGAYMFGNPVSSHYVGADLGLPILTVIFNNQMWNAVRRSTVKMHPDGYAKRSNRQAVTYLDAVEDYHKVVTMADGYGEKVTDPAEMMPALERAMKAVTVEKRQAVLNVMCAEA